MTTTQVEQVAVECWCGISYTIPKSLDAQARRTADEPQRYPKAMVVYCPLGHEWVSGTSSEVKRLRDELARTRGRLDQTMARAEHAERQATKAERKLKRVEKGTCPECHRHFLNVARHMKSKHTKKIEV